MKRCQLIHKHSTVPLHISLAASLTQFRPSFPRLASLAAANHPPYLPNHPHPPLHPPPPCLPPPLQFSPLSSLCHAPLPHLHCLPLPQALLPSCVWCFRLCHPRRLAPHRRHREQDILLVGVRLRGNCSPGCQPQRDEGTSDHAPAQQHLV